MDIYQLRNELETWNIDPRCINIGDIASYDACFNLIHKRNGNWEIFYGEQGRKTDHKVFRTEREACDAFIELLRANMNTGKLADKPEYWKGYRKYATNFQINFMTGLFIFAALLSLAGACYFAFTEGFTWLFWAMVVGAAVFGISAFCSRKERTYEKYEYWGQPIIYGAIILILLVGMIVMPIVNIPNIRASETPVYDTIVLILIEPFFPVCIWGILKFVLDDYVDDLKEYIKKKMKKSDSEYDGGTESENESSSNE
ncbi:MAG: hypothetical protein IKT10_02730 [Clostridiales bacterium]|nr:hypothetical protein [Clostridiales bacterium]